MKNKLPNDDDLLVKITALDNRISHALTNSRKTAKITVRDKLRLINEQLLRFKESGISYKIIRAILKEELQLNVSEQTLREHCQQELNFRKRGAVATDEDENSGESSSIKKGVDRAKNGSITPANPLSTQASTQEHSNHIDTISTQLTQQTTTLIKQIEDY